MTQVIWRIDSPTPPQSPVLAAVEAFCAVRRPDTIATVFEVGSVRVDLTQELENNPALGDAGERIHYLVPPDGEGAVQGPFRGHALPDANGRLVLTMNLLTGDVSVRRRTDPKARHR